MLQPGRKNTLELLFSDLAGADLSNIQEILLWASQPAHSFGVTVDNFRLLPGEKLPLVSFDLLRPNYRELVLPDAKSLQISATLHPEENGVNPKELRLRLTAVAGKVRVSSTLQLGTNPATASLPAAKLPAGPVELTAAVIQASTGQSLLARTWTLHKLTPAELGALQVYIDADNNTVVAGQPFFPLGWFNSTNDSYLDEIADSPFNCVLNYSVNGVLQGSDVRLPRPRASEGPQGHLLSQRRVPDRNLPHLLGRACRQRGHRGRRGRAYSDHPAILAWYLNDELPATMVPDLVGYYQRIRHADPNHPCYIVLCNMSELKYFPETTDVMGVDPYPIPQSPVTRVSEEMEKADAAVRGHQPVWLVPQSFAWYQHTLPRLEPGAHPPRPRTCGRARAHLRGVPLHDLPGAGARGQGA